MLDKLYITPRQWLHIVRWISYTAFFIVVMMIQTVMLGKVTILGVKLTFIPIVITCICLREGPERGGICALLMSLFWCFSGTDFGFVSVFLLTWVPILASLFCNALLKGQFMPSLLSSAVTLLVEQSVIFFLKCATGYTVIRLYVPKVLLLVGLSLVAHPLIYLAVRAISKIGEKYESV